MIRPDIEGASRQLQEDARRRNNPAGYAQERIRSLISAFQQSIADDKEVGISVVGSGLAAPFHLRSISVSNPDILIFDGIDDNGHSVRLLQHHSQMAIMLVAVPKQAEIAFRIGFTAEI